MDSSPKARMRPIKSIYMIAGLLVLLAAAETRAQSCERVVVNCITHRIKIDGWQPADANAAKIDCGKNTNVDGALDVVTYPGFGTIGNMIATQGNAITGGLDIAGINGMGVCGGKMINGYNNASIFHTRPSRKNPTGTDSSNGCIHVSEPVMNYLAMHCVQAPLEIKTPNKAIPPPANCSSNDHWYAPYNTRGYYHPAVQ